jgi:hypothetical protein
MINSRLFYPMLATLVCIFLAIHFFDTPNNSVNSNSNLLKPVNCDSPFEFNKSCPVNISTVAADSHSSTVVLGSKQEMNDDEDDGAEDKNADSKVDVELELEIVQSLKAISQINISPLVSLMINDWRCTKDGVRPDLGLTQTTCNALQNNRSLMNALLIQAQSNPANATQIRDEYALYMDMTSQGKHYKTHIIPTEVE